MVVLVSVAAAKESRRWRKGLVTKLCNQLVTLLKRKNIHSDTIKEHLFRLDCALKDLIVSNDNVIDTLLDPRNMSDNVYDEHQAHMYIESVKLEVAKVVEQSRVKIHELELQENVEPQDSASNVSPSNSLSSRLRLQLKHAQIQAECEAHKRKSNIRLQQLKLQIESEQVDLDTSLKIVCAEKEIVERVGEDDNHACASSQIFQEGRSSTPPADQAVVDDPVDAQVKVTVTPVASGGHSKVCTGESNGDSSTHRKITRRCSVAQAVASSVASHTFKPQVVTSTPVQVQFRESQTDVGHVASNAPSVRVHGEYGNPPSTILRPTTPQSRQTGKKCVNVSQFRDPINVVVDTPAEHFTGTERFRAEIPPDVRIRDLERTLGFTGETLDSRYRERNVLDSSFTEVSSSRHRERNTSRSRNYEREIPSSRHIERETPGSRDFVGGMSNSRHIEREAPSSRYTEWEPPGTRGVNRQNSGSRYRDRDPEREISETRSRNINRNLDRPRYEDRDDSLPRYRTHSLDRERSRHMRQMYTPISSIPPSREVGIEDFRTLPRDLSPSYGDSRGGYAQSRTEMPPYAYLQALQLPRQHIPVFQDDPLTFLPFLRQFDNVVGDSDISNSAKLSHLIHFTSGRARQLIQPCSLMDPEYGYLRARWLLSDRYGDPQRVTQAILTQIRSQRKVPPHDSSRLREFSDDLSSHYEILRSLGRLGEITQNELSDVANQLPDNIIGKWRHQVYKIKYEQNSQPNLGDLVRFVRGASLELSDPVFGLDRVKLRSRAELQERGKTSRRGITKPTRRYNAQIDISSDESEIETHTVQSGSAPNSQNPNQSKILQTTNKPSTRTCFFCSGQHHILQCNKFKEIQVPERRKFAKENKLCYLCLGKGHGVIECKCAYRCRYCQAKHSQFLHIEASSHSTGLEPEEGEFSAPESEEEIECNLTYGSKSEVALPIVPVKVTSNGSKEIVTLALLDGGSQATFCSRRLLDKLQVQGEETEIKLSTMNFSGPQKVEVIGLDVASIDQSESVYIPQVLATDSLQVRNTPIDLQEIQRWPHLQGLDKHFYPQYNSLQVELLIGQDMPECIVPLKVYRGGDSEPYVTVSKMGHSLNGPLGIPSKRSIHRGQKVQHCQTHHVAQDRDRELSEQIERLWQLESVGPSSEKTLSQNDKKALEIWERSVELGKDGHYYLDIPFKNANVQLPNNIDIAQSRLEFTKRKLLRNQDFREKYVKNVTELLDSGYAEQVPPAEINRSDGRVFYLPHHGVIHPEKPDKVRVVYDCSAKCQGYSLNDHVLQGPDLNNNLLGVLLRFRQERIAVQADIDAMFHQVRAKPHDFDALRFLWWPQGDLDKEPEIHRMVVHLFGGVWSPSVCNFALKRTAQDHPEFPQVVRSAVERNFYVDDLLKSLSSPQEGVDFVRDMCDLLSLGGFHIAKWVSNSREVLKTIPEKDRGKEVKFVDLDSGETLPRERALGCRWNVEADTFEYKVKQRTKPLTKRGILSELSSVYDPQGLVAPYILPAKLIFQELCRKKLGWDEQLPVSELASWEKWKSELPSLEEFSMNRCIIPDDFGQVASYQLHHFCDASQIAYGTASYIRVESLTGKVHCTLLLAKSRLAPLKSVSIPRLELMSATLAIKMDRLIREELEVPLLESQFWSDSMIVLYYIRNIESRYKVFVANRLAVIQENSRLDQWHHIQSESNPADIASRGASIIKLMNTPMWSGGPAEIYQSAETWTTIPEVISVDSQDIETRREKQIYKVELQESNLDKLIAKHSSWLGLKRAVAWIKRFIKFLSNKKTTGPLSTQEVREAEVSIVKYVQAREFGPEVSQLVSQSVSKSSRLSPLNPFIDSDGMLRVGGRIKHSQLPQITSQPIILPNKHPIVDAIVREVHILSGHSGSEHVLSQVRARYWIVSGRQAARRACRSCLICRKFTAPLLQQKMADLPPDRVKSGDPPFSHTGVDFFGPFLVKRGRSEVKRYGCIFTCLTTRAVHIEVAHSLDVSSFIQCLTRFIARRGKPHIIRSDNGTNFVGGNRELKQAIREWNQVHIDRYLQQRDIQWLFNVPLASSHGGCWERQIRTIRKVLNGLSHLQKVDEETLVTFLTEAESIVNSRPLTRNPDSVNDLEALTPNHLLLMRGNTLPPGVFHKEDLYSRKRWRQMQYLADIFWKRWLAEYLVELQARNKWTKASQNLKVGDLVLLQDSAPRNLWPLGRVIEVFPNQDGLVRSVRVKTVLNELVRPIGKLCLIEGI